jgi:hypothetical protein
MSEEKLSVRLEAFLAAREGMRGVDPEEVFRANGVELTMTDLREAAQLARRVEEAPVGECVEAGTMRDIYEGELFHGFLIESEPQEIGSGPSLVYKRVRLVREE